MLSLIAIVFNVYYTSENHFSEWIKNILAVIFSAYIVMLIYLCLKGRCSSVIAAADMSAALVIILKLYRS